MSEPTPIVPTPVRPGGWFLLLIAPLVLLGASCSSGSGAAPSAQIDAGAGVGSTLTVTEGGLAGFVLEVPPRSLPFAVSLAVREVEPLVHPGFSVLGPVAAVTPTDLELAVPATVTLPFEDGNATLLSVVVLVRDSAGRVLELGPADTSEPGLATVQTPVLGTFWVAERFFGGFGLSGYLPLNDGDSWMFDGGVEARMDRVTDEVNLAGTALRLSIETPFDDLGLYFAPGGSEVRLLGEFSEVGGRNKQRLFSGEVALLPVAVTVGQEWATTFAYETYTPFGAEAPSHAGDGVLRVRIVIPERPLALAGEVFSNMVRVEVTLRTIDRSENGPGAIEEQSWALTLAKDVGPVRVQAFGVEGYLLEATVGGVVIRETP